MGLFQNECGPAKNDPAVLDLTFISSPSPSSPRALKKNYPQPTQNVFPSNFPITSAMSQG